MIKRIMWLMLVVPGLGMAQERSAEFTKSIQRGALVYEDFCMNCHLANGEGVSGVYPPLANSDFLTKNGEASIRAVKFGMQGEIVVNGETYNSVMAPLGLTDKEVADVMNYINTQWGNKTKKMLTEAEVAKLKK